MAKRFNDTDIWKKQRWFRKLKPDYKLAFYYIKDQCNHAGIWEVDCSDLIEDLGLLSFDINDFLVSINTVSILTFCLDTFNSLDNCSFSIFNFSTVLFKYLILVITLPTFSCVIESLTRCTVSQTLILLKLLTNTESELLTKLSLVLLLSLGEQEINKTNIISNIFFIINNIFHPDIIVNSPFIYVDYFLKIYAICGLFFKNEAKTKAALNYCR